MKMHAHNSHHKIRVSASRDWGASTSRPRLFTLLATLALILALVGLSSCVAYTSAAGNGQPGTSNTGALSPSSKSLSFGNIPVGKTATKTLTVTNTGTSPVNISQATISGTGFSVVKGNPSAPIPVGQTGTIQIQFAPQSAGAMTGNLSIVSDASTSALSVPVSGIGTPAALTMTPSSLSFGNVTVGQSNTQTVKLANSSDTNLVVSGATVTGEGFSISGLSLPTTLSASQSLSFTVRFHPVAAGGVTGNISFTDNEPASPQSFPLTGTGISANSTLNANPGSFAFGNVVVGSSGTQVFTLTNSGTTSITISQASATGTGLSITGFSVPMSLGAGQTTSFTAKFTPTATGNASGTITITSTATDPTLVVALNGTGVQGHLSAMPSSASFGNVVTGNSNSQTISLSNTGTASVTITQANVSGAGLSASGLSLPLTIGAGTSTSFNVVFAPTTAGAVNGSVSLVSNASNSLFTISGSGTGVVATELLGANPTGLSFGSVNDGSNSTLNVTLTNSGNSNVTISSVTTSGTGFSANGVSSGLTLGPSQTATLHVVFAPSNPGGVNGSVMVVSNATNSPATVTLSGTGVQVTSHAVSLNWTASSSSGVTGYNVYRGTTTGSYSRISSSQVPGTTYSDSTVQSGQNITYYYVVTAVNSSNEESADSNMASALVP
jgi:Abnormal spindle-like microcephaly-assoc'd, ASPM-SPD-2-Hydin/HYDIN/CFA65/VesB-like, Ig-like domain